MEDFEQPSIDSVLRSPLFDLADVRSAMDMHFQSTNHRVKRNSYMCSPTTPSTPSIYDALGSHPTGLSVVTTHGLKQKHQASYLVIPQSGRTSVSSINQILFPGAHVHSPSESALYTPTEAEATESPSSSPLLPSPASLPSLSYTPVTPPTPRSPLLPNFPEVSLSLYKNIPFSPTLPSFPDCPFQYYHDHIPISKSRAQAQARLTMETYVTAPSSPISPIGIMLPDSCVMQEMIKQDLFSTASQLDTSIFDFDSETDFDSESDSNSDLNEDDLDDAGSYDGDDELYQDRNSSHTKTEQRTRSNTLTSIQTQFRYSQLNQTSIQQSPSPSPISPSTSISYSPYPPSTTQPSRRPSLEAQLQDLERTYEALKRQHMSSSSSRNTVTIVEQNPLMIQGGLRLSVS